MRRPACWLTACCCTFLAQAFAKIFKKTPEELDMHLVYDVSHNIAKVEEHIVDGKLKQLLVHRKGMDSASAEFWYPEYKFTAFSAPYTLNQRTVGVPVPWSLKPEGALHVALNLVSFCCLLAADCLALTSTFWK